MLRRRVAAHRARPFGEARTGRERHGLGGTRRILIDCTIIFGVGLVLALVGPFGSFAAPFGLRLLYWLAMSYAGYFLYFPAMAGATALAPRLELPEPALWAAACLLATLPMTAVTWLANFLWHAPRWPTIEEALAQYLNVLVLGALVCALFWFARQRHRVEAATETGAEPAAEPGPAALPGSTRPQISWPSTRKNTIVSMPIGSTTSSVGENSEIPSTAPRRGSVMCSGRSPNISSLPVRPW